jgi:hypothetical protein
VRYEVVFDLDAVGYRTWWFPAIGLAITAIAILVVRYRRALVPHRPAWLHRAGPPLLLAFAVLWTAGAFLGTYGEYRNLRSAVRTGRTQVVEGPVIQFTSVPPTGKGPETFLVNGQRFSYSDYDVTAAFNTTAGHGGPVREGALVRVTHVNGSIVRLEIAR